MMEDIIQSMSLNKILIAMLEENGQISVPTSRFVEASNENKELVVEYDDESLSFKFSVRNNNG